MWLLLLLCLSAIPYCLQTGTPYEEGLPPAAYDPWLSTLLIRALLATNPSLLEYVLAQRPPPLAYDGLARQEFLYLRRHPKYFRMTDNVANSQPFGAYKYSQCLK